ncbi:hypothetical protein IJM16_02715 [Candidatus Saccharibacteria bacterium]|nr:hypothetical protein [Candidatus Saccharibacteria bacterium]
MQKVKIRKVVAKDLVNLTGTMFSLYDDSTGEIWEFDPNKAYEDSIADVENAPDVFFVVDRSMLDKLNVKCRDKVCEIKAVGVGRNGVKIAKLSLVDDPMSDVVIACYGGERGRITAY